MLLQTLVIDEFGRIFEANGRAIEHTEHIDLLIENIKLTEHFALETSDHEQHYSVEAADHPIMVQKIRADQAGLWVTAQNGKEFLTAKEKFSFDFQDRLCGLTQKNAPFRLSKECMDGFFELCDEYDDDSFVLGGYKITTPPYYFEDSSIKQAGYWENVYRTDGNPSWNLMEPANALKEMLPKLKLPKSRILVLGGGEGHDASLFAEAGHLVTVVDFSKVAIENGRKRYKDLPHLTFVQENIFNLDHSWDHSYDLVVEHACFCAIPPSQRKQLVDIYARVLHDQGQLMGVFFSMLKRAGPPYGSSELEIKNHLERKFQILVAQRFRKSVVRRQGREFYILGQKRK